jgi:hypothetical protein
MKCPLLLFSILTEQVQLFSAGLYAFYSDVYRSQIARPTVLVTSPRKEAKPTTVAGPVDQWVSYFSAVFAH